MTYTLIADGSSDRVLLPILTWCLKQYTVEPIVEQWADFGRIPSPRDSRAGLMAVLDLYPCEILFVHRDAERQPVEWRREEIAGYVNNAHASHVPVIPVRMTEAWLLVDELAIRSAAGNPNGTESLVLPGIESLEDIPDPKQVLYDALVKATGRNARRRHRFPVQQRVHRISDYIDDYSMLEALPAFQLLQEDIRSILDV